MIKRIFDILFSLLALVVFAPVMLGVAILIRLDSPGPILYKALRVGLNLREFHVYKFRTMVINADKIGGPSTADDDVRITSAGKKLRKYKIDELPQFLNVLLGHMSIVGPRPEVKFYVDQFSEEEKKILSVKPGITDYASLWNSDEGSILSGAEDPETAYQELIRPEKIRLQLKYVGERSMWIDIVIIFRTASAIIFRK